MHHGPVQSAGLSVPHIAPLLGFLICLCCADSMQRKSAADETQQMRQGKAIDCQRQHPLFLLAL